MWLIVKYLITAGVVVLISEMAKRSDKLGGLVAALPLVTFLALYRTTAHGKNSESCVVHVLVRGSDTADVFSISDVVGENRILAGIAFFGRHYDRLFHPLFTDCSSIWDRVVVKRRK